MDHYGESNKFRVYLIIRTFGLLLLRITTKLQECTGITTFPTPPPHNLYIWTATTQNHYQASGMHRDHYFCDTHGKTAVLRLQRRLPQVANLGTSSSRKTFIAFKWVRLRAQTGDTHGTSRRKPPEPATNAPPQNYTSHTLNLGTVCVPRGSRVS